MPIDRREFVKASAALAMAQALRPHASAVETGSVTSAGRMAWGAGTWYRPYVSKLAHESEAAETWVQVDLGALRHIDAVRLYPAFIPSDKYASGFGFPTRFRIECASDPAFAQSRTIADCTAAEFPDPHDEILEFAAGTTEARFVRLTATRLRKAEHGLGYGLALSKIEVTSSGRDIAERCAVSADTRLGNPESLAQLTRRARPMGEGIVTDNPGNVTPPERWRRVTNRAAAPLRGVTLKVGQGLFRQAMENNIQYLLTSFSVDEMLRPFRERAGKPPVAGLREPTPGWDTVLSGSSAGRFLMGAGNTLRWIEHAELRTWLDAIVEGIEECRQPNGYIMAYPEDQILHSERGGYTRAWVTHGLIEAGYAGNPKAFDLLRGFYDWFNQCQWLPRMMRGGTQGVQGMIASTRMYFTPVGKPQDIQTVQRYYQENYWLEGLAARNGNMVWQYPYDRPHNYLITDFEAYFDLYRATGDTRYIDAMRGAWDLYHDHWEHVGGSIAITEMGEFPPDSYRLNAQGPFCETGETCGSVFWIRFNQRFQLMNPDEEKYAAEIEKSIYNVGLANQMDWRGIIYHARLVGMKGDLHTPLRINTCCEGQGTRLLGSLPEYIFSMAPDGVYVNLFEPSIFSWNQSGVDMKIDLEGNFPMSPDVRLAISLARPVQAKIRIRVPRWSAAPMVISINGHPAAPGEPGSYATLDRLWTAGDVVRFTLPMAFRLTRYTGLDQIEGQERYAFEYGPVLMAVTGSASAVLKVTGAKRAEEILPRLREDSFRPLHFAIEGHPEFTLIPYWEVAGEPFTCYPVIDLA